jgi:hypothetical protein
MHAPDSIDPPSGDTMLVLVAEQKGKMNMLPVVTPNPWQRRIV